MPNPFYTPKQRNKALLWISQLLIATGCLIILKLGRHPLVSDWNWWRITFLVWFPLSVLIVVAALLIVFYGAKADRERMDQYLKDIENKESNQSRPDQGAV